MIAMSGTGVRGSFARKFANTSFAGLQAAGAAPAAGVTRTDASNKAAAHRPREKRFSAFPATIAVFGVDASAVMFFSLAQFNKFL